MSSAHSNQCSSDPTMDELVEVRAVLTALGKEEQELLEQLCNVRAAARAQKAKVEQLIGRLPTPPISCLPNELLLQIFEFVVYAVGFRRQFAVRPDHKKHLACVSRRWRNLVLHSPTLWATIEVTPTWSETLVKTHLRRSSPLPLDIELHSWNFSYRNVGPSMESLNGIFADAHRWRSFASDNCTQSRWRDLVYDRLANFWFPCSHVSPFLLLLILWRASQTPTPSYAFNGRFVFA
ncbi:hypothetical protein EDD16DRAFT_1247139 [Pisolithus croceorrhizus]|nr:hypothetical protein EDD16DRAFT_1247139 [Pisolithus croceorrhizus]